MFEKKDLELTAGLGVALGLIAIEMIGFLFGLSMFSPTQGWKLMSCSHCQELGQ